jgi:hypothetical protein
MRVINAIFNRQRGRLLVLQLLAFACASTLWAQQPADKTTVSKETLQLLLKRIDQLETRVSQLEADKQAAEAAHPGVTSPSVNPPSDSTSTAAPALKTVPVPTPAAAQVGAPNPPEAEQVQAESAMPERMDMGRTLLRIRGFGDISLHGDTQKGDKTTFSLGQLDLFVTSDISERFKFLSEIVFEGGPDNFYGSTAGQANSFTVDPERYLLQYSQNDHLNLSVGRGHTAIGYYNTAYHHSTWLQTTTGRPFLFEFEDRGGILPVHIVGVTASGLVSSGPLGLHYVAEVGNGRESRDPLNQEPVQNEISDLNHKAFNFALFAKPSVLPGFQTGFSVYHDLLAPANLPKVGEIIYAAHAVLIRPKYEWLNEALLDRHALAGSSTVFNTPGFYTQASRQFGSFRPYFRYQYINVAKKEPIFPDVGLRHGPSLGLRYDASEFVALKFQYDYTVLRDQQNVNGLTLQLGFTF